MTTTYHRTRDGMQVAITDALDANGVLRDGHSMRTPVMLMDGVPTALTDEQRFAMIDKKRAALSNAWRNPPPQTAAEVADAAQRAGILASITNVYERRDARLQDAWR